MFKDKIKELRKRNNWTQEDVAKHLNISRVAYTRYEIGDREPGFEMTKKIAEYFNVSVDYLLDNSDDPTPPGGKKEHLIQKEQDALQVYNKLVELNDGEDLTQNQKDALLVFFEKNSDYVKFAINKDK